MASPASSSASPAALRSSPAPAIEVRFLISQWHNWSPRTMADLKAHLSEELKTVGRVAFTETDNALIMYAFTKPPSEGQDRFTPVTNVLADYMPCSVGEFVKFLPYWKKEVVDRAVLYFDGMSWVVFSGLGDEVKGLAEALKKEIWELKMRRKGEFRADGGHIVEYEDNSGEMVDCEEGSGRGVPEEGLETEGGGGDMLVEDSEEEGGESESGEEEGDVEFEEYAGDLEKAGGEAGEAGEGDDGEDEEEAAPPPRSGNGYQGLYYVWASLVEVKQVRKHYGIMPLRVFQNNYPEDTDYRRIRLTTREHDRLIDLRAREGIEYIPGVRKENLRLYEAGDSLFREQSMAKQIAKHTGRMENWALAVIQGP